MSPAAFVRCFQDAGVPPGVVNLVYGDPAAISSYLIPHPTIRKVSFTGSVAVGKHLASLAGQHMKRATMELGGHGPVIICKDADLDAAVSSLVFSKFRNSGQVCVSPTRFIVEDGVFDQFVDQFAAAAKTITVGNGQVEGTRMGPLINVRRLDAVTDLVADAVRRGATIATGGRRIGNVGNFFEPTVLTGLDLSMRVMTEKPFGPLALMMPFHTLNEAISEANRLPYGLASYAWTASAATAARLEHEVETGMLTINHLGLGLAELPFGGIKDSGYGSEGGSEAMEAYLSVKTISRLN